MTPRQAMSELVGLIRGAAQAAAIDAPLRALIIEASGDARVALDRKASTWDLDAGPHVIVTDGIGERNLEGDGEALSRVARYTANVWETAQGEDPELVAALVALIEGSAVGGYRRRVAGTLRLPETDATVVHTALEVRHPTG